MSKTEKTKAKKSGAKRGFAAMDPERQREIARMGGRAVTEKGTRHAFTPEEARAAGRLGGKRAQEKRLEAERDAVLEPSGAALGLVEKMATASQ